MLMITEEMIIRINELAHLSKERALTPAEKQEQKELRQAYLAAFRRNLKSQLDNIEVVDPNDPRLRR